MSPTHKPNLIVMCGLPGSGKTTFARDLAERLGFQYIGVDDFYRLMNGDETRHNNKFEVWMTLYRAIHMAERDGRDVVFDTNAPTVTDRSQLLDWFPGFDATLFYISALQCQCVQNNKTRRRVIPEDEMERFFRNFQPPTEDEDKRWKGVLRFYNMKNQYYFKDKNTGVWYHISRKRWGGFA